MKALFLAVVLTLPVSAALAEPSPPSDAPVVEATSLTEDQLREAIIGKTVYLNVSGFELPIRYRANGRMTGSMGTVAATFSRGDGSRDNGRRSTGRDQAGRAADFIDSIDPERTFTAKGVYDSL